MKKILKIILVIICLVSIFMFSSDTGDSSSTKSDGIIIKTFEFLKGRRLKYFEKEKYIDTYVVFIRKSAHFFIYFLLGVLVLSLLKEYKSFTFLLVIYATLFVFFYACSDEVHQLFVTGRSGEFLDVLLDSLGGFVGSISYYFIRSDKK